MDCDFQLAVNKGQYTTYVFYRKYLFASRMLALVFENGCPNYEKFESLKTWFLEGILGVDVVVMVRFF